ncbi:hypothetical protein [Arenibacter nanhaiticus]|uniref:hypothetical protein n=1 Tax=Arenibacter nanhaiticus TaxID=558155 RepID=UPI001C49EBF8|nr:hypothetical protein [Arenibacter nanhaiticus]
MSTILILNRVQFATIIAPAGHHINRYGINGGIIGIDLINGFLRRDAQIGRLYEGTYV